MPDGKKVSLEIWSLRLDLMMKTAVCLLAVTLVLFPGKIIDLLNQGEAVVTEVNIFGVKIRVDTSDPEEVDALYQKQKEALDEAATLRLNNENLAALLNCTVRKMCSRDQSSEITALTGGALPDNFGMKPMSVGDNGVVKIEKEGWPAVTGEQYSVFTGLQQSVIASAKGADEWVIVAGADKTLSSAEYEAARLKKAGFSGEVVRRGNWYRTIVRFDNIRDAESAEQKIRKELDRDVYVFPFAGWCTMPTVGEDGLLLCQ